MTPLDLIGWTIAYGFAAFVALIFIAIIGGIGIAIWQDIKND